MWWPGALDLPATQGENSAGGRFHFAKYSCDLTLPWNGSFWEEVVLKVCTFILTELSREFTLTKHLLCARCHAKCFPRIISLVSSHQFCEVGVLTISFPLVGKRCREDKWPAEHHVPWSCRVRTQIQAVWLQVSAQPCWPSGTKAMRGMGLLHWGHSAELP